MAAFPSCLILRSALWPVITRGISFSGSGLYVNQGANSLVFSLKILRDKSIIFVVIAALALCYLLTARMVNAMMNVWEFSKAINAMQKRIEKAIQDNGMQCHVSYVAYSSDDEGMPIDNLDTVPIKGKMRFSQQHSDYWGSGTEYTSKTVEDPSWIEIAILANKMIEVTGDYHHKHLKSVKKLSEKRGVIKAGFIMES